MTPLSRSALEMRLDRMAELSDPFAKRDVPGDTETEKRERGKHPRRAAQDFTSMDVVKIKPTTIAMAQPPAKPQRCATWGPGSLTIRRIAPGPFYAVVGL
jgi:hypothetical protein